MSDPLQLRITEIFHSLQGEAATVGRPTVFVRLTGCPLRCQYCDTAYAFTGGELLDLDAILAKVESFQCSYVTVTGGEPLAQRECMPLLTMQCDRGFKVSLETSGALPIESVDERVSVVMDLKTPGSQELSRNLDANIRHLKLKDQVKFVICDRRDYEWSRSQLLLHRLDERAGEVLFSPSHEELAPAELARWILDDRLPVRMQMQLHKLIWGNAPGH